MIALVPQRLAALPLAAWERDGLSAALRGAGLPADDVAEPKKLFWRFENSVGDPVGFGGLEIVGSDALLRSVVTLLPLRRRGYGRAIVLALEGEAVVHRCDTVYALVTQEPGLFGRLGYGPCSRDDAPAGIAETAQFARLCPAGAPLLVKRLDPAP